MLLDQRRTADPVAGGERGAGIGRRRAEGAVEVDPAAAAGGGALGRALAAADFFLRRLAHDAGDGRAQAHDLGLLLRRRCAIALLVHRIEVALDGGAVLAREHRQRQVNRHRMLLSDIAHVGRALEHDLARRDRAGVDGGTTLMLELAIDVLDAIERRIFEPGEPGADMVVAQVGEQHAEGREHAGGGRNDHRPDPDLARDQHRMQWTGAAISHQREVAGIEAALGGDALDRIGHRGHRDAQNSFGRRGGVHAERPGDTLDQRTFGGFDIEPHLTAEKAVGGEPPEHEVGIGHRRLGAAAAVAGRPRHRSGALRSDAQPALLHPRDRAAAGADLENIHHGDLHRERAVIAADQGGAGGERVTIVDDAGLGSGPAHVEGDCVLETERMAQGLGADDAGRRTRFQHVHTVPLGLLRLVEAAVRLHDQERPGKARAPDALIDLADIAPHDRPDIGVGDHRRAALELAVFLGQLVRGGDEQRGVVALQDRLGARFMIRPGIAVEKQDRGSFHADLLEPAAQAHDLRLVERRVDLAVGQHPLLDLETQRAFDQRHVLLEEQVVGVGTVDAADLVDVAKALGDQEPGLRPRALEDGVDGDGGAVQKQPGGAIIAAGLGDAGIDAFDQPLRRQQRLAESKPAGALVEHGDIGEGAADIGGQADPGGAGSGGFGHRDGRSRRSGGDRGSGFLARRAGHGEQRRAGPDPRVGPPLALLTFCKKF